MPLTLHAAFVPTCRQIIAATGGLIDKAEAWCAERKVAPETLLGTRVIADMHHLGYQLKSVAVHSGGAIRGVRGGVFSPDTSRPEQDFAAYRALLAEADATLAGTAEDEMERWIGRDMAFVAGERRVPFTADQFLLSFSQPNFLFHATTAYAILRGQGLAVGKLDFIGRPRRAD